MHKWLTQAADLYHKRTANRLKVLAYHEVNDSENFEKQISYLKDHYNVIGPDFLIRCLDDGRKLPDKPVMITFDDGRRNVYEQGLPILRKYDLPSISFVITDLIDTEEPFWWDLYRGYHKNGQIDLKKISNTDRLSHLKDLPDDYVKSCSTRQLRYEELCDMERHRMWVGNHTASHPLLDKCEESTVKEELKKAHDYLEEKRIKGRRCFAYPNGNYSGVAEKTLKKLGVELTFLFDHKVNDDKINPQRISRLSVDSDTPLSKFKLILSGLHSKLLPLRLLIK